MTMKAAMNCWEALEVLEGINAGAIGADDALSIEAQSHLAGCTTCQAALPQRLKWNAGLTEAMAAVAVPPELESQLAQHLQPQTAVAVDTASPSRKPRHRRVIALLTAAALLWAIIVWVRMSPRQNEMLTKQTVEANIGCELSQLTEYNSPQWQPELPMSWRGHFTLNPRLVYAFPPDQPHAVAALVPFEFHNSRLPAPIRGRLVMIPASRFRGDRPASKDFLAAPVDYVAGYGFCAWTEGEWVYLCYVRSSAAEMEQFQRLLGDSRNVL